MPGNGPVFRMSGGMPENGKILAVGGDAAWLWVCAIAYARRNGTDGVIPVPAVPKLSDRKQPGRLARALVASGLWHEPGHGCPRCPCPLPGNYVIHDYLDWQGTAGSDRRSRDAKGAGGSFGNHQRWHVGRGHLDPDCQFCIAACDQITSDERSHMRSDTDRMTDQSSESGANRISESLPGGDFRDHGLPPKKITPPISPPPGSDDRSSDHGKPKARTRRQAYDYDGDLDFHRFWAAFPQKSGKPAAYKAWLAARGRGADPEQIIAAAKRYADDPQRDPHKTKYPQGWLNDERYNDVPPTDDSDDDEWST